LSVPAQRATFGRMAADPLSVEQANALERSKALAKRRENAQIFREVFGVPGNLTPHGKVILEALHKTFGRGIPKNILDDHGRTDALQTWRALGHRDVLESIYETLAYKESDNVYPSGSSP
jgi:hypothetical protein